MSGYPGYFIEHWGQLTALAVALAVWLGFGAVGAVVVGRDRMDEATPMYGWAIASFAFTVVGTFTAVPFTWVAVALAAAALVAAAAVIRRGDGVLPVGSVRTAILAAPLLILVSAMVGSQWDEFADWLISPRLMLELDGFPDDATKVRGGSLAAYPYGWHLVTYLASRLAGRLVENAGALVNVFLLLTFGLVIVRLIREGLGRGPDARPGWGLLAIGALSTTLANPTFAQKVALTSYADVAAAVALGFGGVLGWRMLGRLAAGADGDARRLAFEAGLVMLVLVNLKQGTVALFGLLIGAVLLAGLRDPGIRPRKLFGMLGVMALPGIVIFAVWQYYLATRLTGAALKVRPFEQWQLHLIPQILWMMLVVFSKKGLYLAMMAAVTAFGIRGLFRFRTPFDRLAVIVGAMFLGYNAFLLFVYVSTFGKMDALRVASLWRYNMHLGPLGVACAAYGAALLWPRYAASRLDARKLGWLPVALILAAPFAFADKLRFDRHPPVPYFRAVARAVADVVKPGDRLMVVDPRGSGESAMIVRYELKDPAIMKGYLGLYHARTPEAFRNIFKKRDLTHVLVHSVVPEMQGIVPPALTAGMSYLLERDGRGGWRVVRSWKAP